jgi:hypothetical protein
MVGVIRTWMENSRSSEFYSAIVENTFFSQSWDIFRYLLLSDRSSKNATKLSKQSRAFKAAWQVPYTITMASECSKTYMNIGIRWEFYIQPSYIMSDVFLRPTFHKHLISLDVSMANVFFADQKHELCFFVPRYWLNITLNCPHKTSYHHVLDRYTLSEHIFFPLFVSKTDVGENIWTSEGWTDRGMDE